MKRYVKAISGNRFEEATKAAKADGKSKRKILAVLNYDVSYDDPADWEIDYDMFFELIESSISKLGLDIDDIEDEETIGGRICTYILTNGECLDSYDLEIELLSGLNDGSIKDSGIRKYIETYIRNHCM